MRSWISHLTQLAGQVDTARLIDEILVTLVCAAIIMNVFVTIASSRGMKLIARKVKETENAMIFPAMPQLVLLACIFVPLGLLLAHQHTYSWARWQTYDNLSWLWVVNSLVWLLIPLLSWPGAISLEDRGLRQPSLLSREKYIPYDEIAQIRWRQLNIIVVSRSGVRIIHTPAHCERTLFEDEIIAATDPKITAFRWDD
jgi:hypothetical protein